MKRFSPFFLLALSLSLLTACGTAQKADMSRAQYWQRADIRTAVHMDPDKAHDMLQRDVAACVAAVRESESVAALREAIPGHLPPGTPEGHLSRWDTPERDGSLRAEHTPYHDFETCMMHKGWERAGHLPPAVLAPAVDSYLDRLDPKRQKEKIRRAAEKAGDSSSNLNRRRRR